MQLFTSYHIKQLAFIKINNNNQTLFNNRLQSKDDMRTN